MTTTDSTSTALSDSRSRNVLLALLGVAASAVCTALGTFGDLTGDESGEGDTFGEYWPVLVVTVVAAAIVFGLVVRTAADGDPGRRALMLSIVGAVSIAVFWSGLPMVLVAGAVACALIERDLRARFGGMAKAALALSALVTAAAIWLAIYG